MPLSAIAQQFSAARNAANLNALAKAEPLVAAKFLSRAATAGGLDGPWKAQLDQILSPGFDAGQRETAIRAFFAQNQPALQAFEMAALQAARVDTLGFTTSTPEPVEMQGLIGLAPDGGAPTLTTAEGTFRLEMPNWPDKPASGNQSAYFEVNVLQSFAGRAGTVRAYPTETPGVLAVEEFSPSTNPNFTSGRLSTQNGKLGINVRPDKWVEIRDPATAEAMKHLAKERSPGQVWGGTGIIVQGAVAKKDAQGWYLDGQVKDYWMLGRSNGAGSLLAGHGQSYPVQGGATPWPENAAVRLLVYGHANADRSIAVTSFLQTPQVRVEAGVASKRDSASLLKLAPVDDTPAGGTDKFD